MTDNNRTTSAPGPRDATFKASDPMSGVSMKESFKDTSVESLGMGNCGPNTDGMEGNKPCGNPTVSTARDCKIR
jgi:hypothetical protein